MFLLVGCNISSENSTQYESGTKITITMNNYTDFVHIKAKRLAAKTTNDLFIGIVFKYDCEGYEEFSYYNVEITIKVNAKALNDSGEYEDVEFTKVIFLDESGDGVKHDTYEFGTSFRNLKDITWKVFNVKGFVVKK